MEIIFFNKKKATFTYCSGQVHWFIQLFH